MPKGGIKLTVNVLSGQEEFHTGRQQFKLDSIILTEALYKMVGFLEFIACDQA